MVGSTLCTRDPVLSSVICNAWQAAETSGTTKRTYYRSALVKVEHKPEVVTLQHSDLQRMLSDAPIMTAEQRSSVKHAAEERKEQERAAAKARKEKMLQLEEVAKKQVCCFTSNVL